ncbi:unnamed protein product [Rotaria sp. Silwood2]|nr:unnamed protein product [Rotaria sp. Silwood2]CAF2989461.1 unnamed protein product [Rotaria sp. Silwood2]CAF3346646.1 unnamed protein product [Rotaria sp. Silwood2]CAF4196926.1 unnamed protein product [Rotaria sp. Silwood2]CAF4306612.1 unnamed protein product [Rotaria sp. Silwood2]
MPIGGNNTEPRKKRSNKKRTLKQASKSKRRITEKNEAKNSKKNACNANESNLNTVTQGNLSSLRWDNVLSDATLENDRIEQYKELRRQRYSEARQQAIETIVEKMKITTVTVPEK